MFMESVPGAGGRCRRASSLTDRFAACTVGNEAWTLALEWPGHEDFVKADNKKWKVGKKHAGDVRKVGKGAGDFAFIRVFDAGHMVPMDVPEEALDMFTKWIRNEVGPRRLRCTSV